MIISLNHDTLEPEQYAIFKDGLDIIQAKMHKHGIQIESDWDEDSFVTTIDGNDAVKHLVGAFGVMTWMIMSDISIDTLLYSDYKTVYNTIAKTPKEDSFNAMGEALNEVLDTLTQ